jgi:hypothetical protein
LKFLFFSSRSTFNKKLSWFCTFDHRKLISKTFFAWLHRNFSSYADRRNATLYYFNRTPKVYVRMVFIWMLRNFFGFSCWEIFCTASLLATVNTKSSIYLTMTCLIFRLFCHPNDSK